MQTNPSPEDRPERAPFFISAGNFFQFVRWMLIATLTGIVVGSVSTLFNFALKYAVDFRRSHLWVILLLPAAGLLIVFLYKTFHYENNTGTDAVIDSIHEEAHIPLRMSFLILSLRYSRCSAAVP